MENTTVATNDILQYDFSKLPMEILIQIFSYLNAYELQPVTLTCWQWLNATQCPLIRSRNKLKLTAKISSLEKFSFKYRHFSNVHICNTTIPFDFNINLPYEYVTFLTIEKFHNLQIEDLLVFIRNLKNLKEIVLINCNLITWRTETSRNDIEKFDEIIANLKSLTFECIEKFKMDRIPITITLFANARNLETFNIICSPFVRHFQFDEEFEIIFDEKLRLIAGTLKVLRLPYDFKTTKFLKSLQLLDIQLETLDLIGLRIKNWLTINEFTLAQNQIKNLNLSDSLITDDNFEILVRNLKAIESLEIQSCKKLTNKSLIKISNLKNLKKLNISRNMQFTSKAMRNSVIKDINLNLIELNTLGVSFNESTYIQMGESLLNIRKLQIGCKAINDNGIQSIIRNCTDLIELNLFDSMQISDYGLTGLEVMNLVQIQTGFSISNLNKLQHLNLRRCSKITDVTLINGLKLPHLKILHLPSCFPFLIEMPTLRIRKISVVGYETFVTNCPNIEELNLMGCSGYELLDVGIEIVATKLKYLKILQIARRCELRVDDQLAILYKGRRDLSIIRIKCKCCVCKNIRQTCEEFFDEKDRWLEDIAILAKNLLF